MSKNKKLYTDKNVLQRDMIVRFFEGIEKFYLFMNTECLAKVDNISYDEKNNLIVDFDIDSFYTHNSFAEECDIENNIGQKNMGFTETPLYPEDGVLKINFGKKRKLPFEIIHKEAMHLYIREHYLIENENKNIEYTQWLESQIYSLLLNTGNKRQELMKMSRRFEKLEKELSKTV